MGVVRAICGAALAVAALGGCSQSLMGRSGPRDTVIVNAQVIDGSGKPPARVDVRISGDRIVGIGSLKRRSRDLVIDGQGMTLAPGFIDTHSHHDAGLDEHPDALPLVSQGVTTIIAGQDGGESENQQSLREVIAHRSLKPSAVNFAYFAGHNTIRARAMGGKREVASSDDLAKMREYLRQDMAAGALGLSTGLEYEPGRHASSTEVETLAEEAAKVGGRYISHMRNEDNQLNEAIGEVLSIARQTAMPVQISHLKLGGAMVWGKSGEILGRLDQANARGLHVSVDVYPYDRWQTALISLYPDRDYEDLAKTRMVLDQLVLPEDITIVRYRPDPGLVGKTLLQIATNARRDPPRMLIDMLRATGGADSDMIVIGRSMREPDVEALIQWSRANICSDGSMVSAHPRGSGAFARILATMVRERKVLALPDAIRKMTGLSADHMGLHDRGYIRVGYKADLMLFDPDTVQDEASFVSPARLATGVAGTWVNGVRVWSGGSSTGRLPGRFLPRQDTKPWR
jgi:N-acyl-D-amino-acid deacylase